MEEYMKLFRKLVGFGFKISRIGADLSALMSGSVWKILRRLKNKILGRQVGKRIFK